MRTDGHDEANSRFSRLKMVYMEGTVHSNKQVLEGDRLAELCNNHLSNFGAVIRLP